MLQMHRPVNVRNVLLDMKISKRPYSFKTLDILSSCKILFIKLFSTSLSHDLFGSKTQSFDIIEMWKYNAALLLLLNFNCF